MAVDTILCFGVFVCFTRFFSLLLWMRWRTACIVIYLPLSIVHSLAIEYVTANSLAVSFCQLVYCFVTQPQSTTAKMALKVVWYYIFSVFRTCAGLLFKYWWTLYCMRFGLIYRRIDRKTVCIHTSRAPTHFFELFFSSLTSKLLIPLDSPHRIFLVFVIKIVYYLTENKCTAVETPIFSWNFDFIQSRTKLKSQRTQNPLLLKVDWNRREILPQIFLLANNKRRKRYL